MQWRADGFAWHGCDYASKTHQTRLARIYRLLCVKKLTPRALEMMSPEKCPFFTPGVQAETQAPADPALRARRVPYGRISELWHDGYSDRQIASFLHVSRSSVVKWRMAFAKDPNPPKTPPDSLSK